jgi:hypothetical protein
MLSFPTGVGISDTSELLTSSIADGDKVFVEVGIADISELVTSSIADGDKVFVEDGIADTSVAFPTPTTDGDSVFNDSLSNIDVVGIDVNDGGLVGERPVDVIEDAGDGTDVTEDSTPEGSSDPSSGVDNVSVSISVSLLVTFFAASGYCSQYGHSPLAKHSSKDSAIPLQPSSEEMVVIPITDAA